MSVAAVYAHRYNARLRMRPRPEPDWDIVPAPVRQEPLWWLPATWLS